MRDKNHLKRVASLPCVVCGYPAPSEAHHPRGLKWGCGTGLKAGDEFVIPLCHPHHHEYHQKGKQTWEALHGTHEDLLEKTKLALLMDELGGNEAHISALEEELNGKIGE